MADHQVTFPQAVEDKLAEVSRETGRSVQDIVQTAVAKYLRVSLDDCPEEPRTPGAEVPKPVEMSLTERRLQIARDDDVKRRQEIDRKMLAAANKPAEPAEMSTHERLMKMHQDDAVKREQKAAEAAQKPLLSKTEVNPLRPGTVDPAGIAAALAAMKNQE